MMRRQATPVASLEDPRVPLSSAEFQRIAGGEPTWTGRGITVSSAITWVSMFACVRVLAESVAQLPGAVFEHMEKGRRQASEHWLYPIVESEANAEMTAYEWREVGMYHLGFKGNFYSEIEWNNAGTEVLGVWPLRPDRTTPERINGEILYKTYVRKKLADPLTPVWLPADRVLHIPGPGFDGLKGIEPLTVLRQAIGLGLALEEYASRVFSNGGSPRILLRYPTTVTPDTARALRADLDKVLTGGLDNAHRTAILEEGVTFDKLSWDPTEVQALGARTHQSRQVASFYRVPAHMVNDLEHATFTNIEHQELELVKHALAPYNIRFEQRFNRLLRSVGGKNKYYVRFNVDGLLRGDYKTRTEGHAQRIQNGLASPDECRELDEMNPRDDGLGGKYWMPSNMMLAETAAAETANEAKQRRDSLRQKDPAVPMPPTNQQAPSKPTQERVRSVYEAAVLVPAYSDLARTECNAVGRLLDRAEKSGFKAVEADLAKFYESHEARMASRLLPGITGLARLLDGEVPALRFCEGAVRRYVARSMECLVSAAAAEGNSIANMRRVIEDWREDRPVREAAAESARIIDAINKGAAHV